MSLIVPAPELRVIVDKTAEFVARHGIELEAKIRDAEQGSARFSFLTPGDPYRPYYESRLTASRADEVKASVAAPQREEEVVRARQEAPLGFLTETPPWPMLDLGAMRLTALFVARNGLHWMSLVADREAGNPQFGFLDPDHEMYPLFVRLVEEYKRVLAPTDDGLAKYSRTREQILEDARHRAQSLKHGREEAARAESDRTLFDSIDWNDFCPIELTPDNARPSIRVKCEVCGAMVHEDELEEHLRVELLDPKWHAQKRVHMARYGSSNLLTSGSEIARNLRTLTGHREDICDPQSTSLVIRVQAPSGDGGQWNLHGQVLEFPDMDPDATVDTLKSLVAEQTRVPVSRQKLLVPGQAVLKSAHRIAELGFPCPLIHLELKERGGARK